MDNFTNKLVFNKCPNCNRLLSVTNSLSYDLHNKDHRCSECADKNNNSQSNGDSCKK